MLCTCVKSYISWIVQKIEGLETWVLKSVSFRRLVINYNFNIAIAVISFFFFYKRWNKY